MIITKTPFRISFFGGGTDIPEYYGEHGGAVLSTTFDKYCYVTVRHFPQFFEYDNELCYSKIERVNVIEEIKHPSIREGMKMLDMHNIRLTYEADLPARSGLGTSSSFAVGMLNAFYALKGKYVSKRKLADDAIYLERVLCKEAGGHQDQIAVSYGGFNRIDFKGDNYEVSPIIIQPSRKKQLERNLMLFFTGISRYSFEIQNNTVNSVKSAKKQLDEMMLLVDEAEKILLDKNRNIDEFGELLDITWKLKRGTGNKISSNQLDDIYQIAMDAGAKGGKLLGAGGGGFFLFYVTENNQKQVRDAMEKFMMVPFEFEEGGTKVLYYVPETYGFTSQDQVSLQINNL
jgi:D-glycero-alpha-D-manno-heptose-7-phosphate kinase